MLTESLYSVSTDPRGVIFVEPRAYVDMDTWHSIAAELRHEAPVLRVEASGWEPFWALTRYADVRDVSRRSDLFWSTPTTAPAPLFTYQLTDSFGVHPETLVQMHGHEHQAHRNITNEWFKPAAVKHRQAAIDAVAELYLDKMRDLGGECDFARDIAVPYTLRIIMSLFGVPEADEAFMLELTQGIFGSLDPEYMPQGAMANPMAAANELIGKFTAYFAELAADRRRNPADDVATVIANGMVDGEPISANASLWYYVIIATAGHDTTSFSLSGGLEQLLRDPAQFEALQNDPTLAANAAEEVIRWSSPVRSFFRYPQQDTVIRGVEIPAGDAVLLSYPSANRDADIFTDPDRFDIRRPDADKTLAFGIGVHHCLGAQIARREVRTFLAKLATQIDTIELTGPAEYSTAHFVGGVKHLPIRYAFKN